MESVQLLADSGGWGHMSDWGMGLGWLTMTVVLLGAGWLIWSSVREGTTPSRSGASKAIDLLQQRYASGDIGRDEYLERRSDLEGE